MAETQPTQGFWSSLAPTTAGLLTNDQAIDSGYTINNRLLPNVETIAAMQVARSGEVQSFTSINALLDNLDAVD